ncbi:Uncharacterized protein BM_BM4168 [Brugia malayi]|uniref:Bm4168 n=1 Tax=Brugia malayi TaxID=6279 RepID=A0A0H5S6U4_BRUMA|nr:Uncharacterized protein BM_BM4168 [Brugia malayi]CRZ23873.1 Bm4168 [Brugia malayi]VIO87121.1 Uncharacterized protein BM_BM4168 [Brugia malayi]
MQLMNERCTMVINWDFIVPPTCVIVRKVRSRCNKQQNLMIFGTIQK